MSSRLGSKTQLFGRQMRDNVSVNRLRQPQKGRRLKSHEHVCFHSDCFHRDRPRASPKRRQNARSNLEVEAALRHAGLIALDEQARALGLPRSTMWKLLNGNRRSVQPSAATINVLRRQPKFGADPDGITFPCTTSDISIVSAYPYLNRLLRRQRMF